MKLLFLLFLIGIVGITVYFFSSKRVSRTKKQKQFNGKPIIITGSVVALLVVFVAFGVYQSTTQPDTQCTAMHAVTSKPPTQLVSFLDYFEQGNYEYDIGNCTHAISDYTKSIQLNPRYPQAYNNRAYTFMRMKDYTDALPDLDKAITLNPTYIQALMNRGDIHNYYYAIDRQSAIADYKKVISLGGTHGTSVCGHLFLAKHNGWTVGAYLDFFRGAFATCQ